MTSLASLPPAQPVYILRGHASQIHFTTFIRQNSRLVTGDADGWIVLWDLATKRATAVWRAHEGSILTVAEWGRERLITHGKDNKLVVWKLREEDEEGMSEVLPVEDGVGNGNERRKPWILHILEVNTLNFCSFAFCSARSQSTVAVDGVELSGPDKDASYELLIAVPNALTSHAVDIFHLPSQKRLYTVSGSGTTSNPQNTGMVMAISIFYHPVSQALTIISGYESGHTTIITQNRDSPNLESIPSSSVGSGPNEGDGSGGGIRAQNGAGRLIYMAQPHSQPILSLSVAPDYSYYITSGADAIIAKHPIPASPYASKGKGKEKTTEEPTDSEEEIEEINPSPATEDLAIYTTPLKVVKSGHSGQQSLKLRSDALIFATAGWDARVRVYAAKTLREVAVLKWHGEGCFAVAFAEIFDTDVDGKVEGRKQIGDGADLAQIGGEIERKELVKLDKDVRVKNLNAKEKRILKAKTAHWLAAGSKDGKVSLWEVY